MKFQNWRSTAAYVLLFVFTIPILAACGGGSSASPTSAPAADSATTAPAGATSAAPATGATAAATAAEAATAPAAGATTEATAAATAAATGNTATGSEKAGTLRMNIGSEPDNWDPQKASFVGEIQWIMLNYQALMTFDKTMKPVPGQAESVSTSADGKTYTSSFVQMPSILTAAR